MKQGRPSEITTTGEYKRLPWRIEWQKRKCLKCSKEFDSEGSHNWICRDCKTLKDWRSGYGTTYHEPEVLTVTVDLESDVPDPAA